MENKFEINKLPKLLSHYQILSRVDLKTLFSLFQCCKSFAELSVNDHFWERHVKFCCDPMVYTFFRPSERDWKWVARCQKRINLSGVNNFTGYGTYIFYSNVFIGEFKNSKLHGYGRILKNIGNDNKPKYIISMEGYFENGKPHGKILRYYELGEYDGDMSEGKIEGHGKMLWKDGSQYSGQWKDGKREGEGILTYPSGSKFVGSFSDNKKHGKGTQYYSTGEEFFSEKWEDGKVSNFDEGVYKWSNGNSYVGQFNDDSLIGGFGEFNENDGFQIKGEFKKDEKSKNGIPVDYPDCLNPLIVEVLKKQKCTREVTGEQKIFYGQVLFSAHDKLKHFVCESCMKTCRNNFYFCRVFVGNSTCRCGSFDDIPCKIMNHNNNF